jgi:hypothetical protein
MQLHNIATGQYADVPDRSVNAWMRRGWTAVQPVPEPEEDAGETGTAAEDQSRGKSSARTKKD